MTESWDEDTVRLGIPKPPPDYLHALTHDQREAVFGKFAYTSDPQPGNPEHIHISALWLSENIATITIPQLPGRQAALNKQIKWQFAGLWQAWQDAGLLPLVLSFDGAWVPRFKRGRAFPPHGTDADLSNHAWGTAFDINAQWNPMGHAPLLSSARGSTAELVPLAEKWGWAWGGHFTQPYCDPMHFEVAVIMQQPPREPVG